MNVGILAYGSLIANPGAEIEAVTIESRSDILTPFQVEFARTSRERRGAPTLVPVVNIGAAVRAHVLVLNTTIDDARDRLYRREINAVGSGRRYKHSERPGPNTVVVQCVNDFAGLDRVLYTEIAANIENLSAARLADLAIASAAGPHDGRDGISYLMDAKRYGIDTSLSGAYEDEIKKRMNTGDLLEALKKARQLCAPR
jgi:hypothetical protein